MRNNPLKNEMKFLFESLATHKKIVDYNLDAETTASAEKEIRIIESRLELLRGQDE